MIKGPVIKLDGVPFETVIDDHGVQRFPRNEVVDLLLEQAQCLGVGLNALWIQIGGDKKNKDMQEFYRLIGYSICGYAEIFPDVDIDNFLWRSDDPSK